jgi:ATP-dependent DNA helicase UvrD/PcrA
MSFFKTHFQLTLKHAPFIPTQQQELVINHSTTHHGRILAGPGTGKSATVVSLVSRLLEADPALRLRLITFTRAATGELARKVSLHPAAAALRPSTMHSFAIATLLRNPGAANMPEPLRIADDWEQATLVRPTLARRAGVGMRTVDKLVRELAAAWESLRPHEDPVVDPQERARFLGAWAEHRLILGYTMLAELPYQLRAALRNHPNLQGVDFTLLIVDEYQDLNACDLDLIQLISARGCHILAAGDDDQSIYSMRKAAPEGIRRFPTDYPGAVDYPLTIAQRFGRRIIEWACHVIEGDPDRPRRPRLTPAANNPDGEAALLSFRGERAEARGVAAIARQLISLERVQPSEVLILLRSDHDGQFSTPIKEELQRVGVAYSDPDSVKRILSEPSNRRFLELLRLLDNERDSLAWTALLKLTNGIGDAFFNSVYDQARIGRVQFGAALLTSFQNGFVGHPGLSAARARDLLQEIVAWRAQVALPLLPPQDGWGAWALDLVPQGFLPAPTQELQDLLRAIDSIIEPDQTFGRYLSQITPLAKDRALATSDGVRIMTLTGAKGLTVDAVIIAALEEGIVPRPDSDLAEERRLLYVGMTRARRFLFGTWARSRRGPTARAGRPRVGQSRTHSTFLDDGPVQSEDGDNFIQRR